MRCSCGDAFDGPVATATIILVSRVAIACVTRADVDAFAKVTTEVRCGFAAVDGADAIQIAIAVHAVAAGIAGFAAAEHADAILCTTGQLFAGGSDGAGSVVVIIAVHACAAEGVGVGASLLAVTVFVGASKGLACERWLVRVVWRRVFAASG